MSAAGKRHLKRVHQLNCVICLKREQEFVRCDEAHHLEAYRDDHSDFATIPLCKRHHDLLHQMHRRPFYLLYYLDDVKLLGWTIEQLMEAKR